MIARYSGQGTWVYAGLLVLAGFAMIGLGWRGAAATLFIPTQVAYALSGGLAGIALIGTGAALLNAQASRVATAERTHRLDEVVHETAATVSRFRGWDSERSRV